MPALRELVQSVCEAKDVDRFCKAVLEKSTTGLIGFFLAEGGGGIIIDTLV